MSSDTVSDNEKNDILLVININAHLTEQITESAFYEFV